MDVGNMFAEPAPARRISKGAQRRAEKANPVATEYQLGCIRRHFARIQRGFPNRASEQASVERTKRSRPTRIELMHPHKKAAQAASMLNGADIIDLFIRRGMRLQSRRWYRKPLVSGIKQSLAKMFK